MFNMVLYLIPSCFSTPRNVKLLLLTRQRNKHFLNIFEKRLYIPTCMCMWVIIDESLYITFSLIVYIVYWLQVEKLRNMWCRWHNGSSCERSRNIGVWWWCYCYVHTRVPGQSGEGHGGKWTLFLYYKVNTIQTHSWHWEAHHVKIN